MKKLVVCFLIASTAYSSFAKPKPLAFIENKGQWQADIKYRAKYTNGNVYLSADGLLMEFWDGRKVQQEHLSSGDVFYDEGLRTKEPASIEGNRIKLQFLYGNPQRIVPGNPEPFYYNYFQGADQTKWASGVRAYQHVTYENFYPGINAVVYAQGPNIKYDWIVAAGADPAQIKWQYSGQDTLYAANGSLHVSTPYLSISEQKPIAWQYLNGKKVMVQVRYKIIQGIVQFEFPNGYDSCESLVIDPLLIFSTFSGGTADNWGSTATPGEKGTAYSAGVVRDSYINSSGQLIVFGTLPRTSSSFQVNNASAVSAFDIAIFKYDSAGTNLLWASYLGGAGSDSPHSLIVNKNDELIVLGTTSSSNFPLTPNAPYKSFSGGTSISPAGVLFSSGSDIVLTRISKNGQQLLTSTYFGGTNNDGLNPSRGPLSKNYGDEQRGDIAIDEANNVYIATVTTSADVPRVNSADDTFNGGLQDGLLLKFNPQLTSLLWSTYIGGDGEDALHSIKILPDGNLLLGGGTTSDNFPVTSGAFQTTNAGQGDGWIAKVNPQTSAVLQATFTGTANYNQVYFVDFDGENNVYVYGQTEGPMDITPGKYNNPNSGQFLQSFTPDLSTRRFSTVFGSGVGIPNISPTAFSVNDCGYIYMAGWGGGTNITNRYWNSTTLNMPTTADAQQRTTTGSDFYFIVLGENATKLLYATFLGGQVANIHVDGGTSRFDRRGVVYHAVCAGCGGFDDFPTTANAWSRVNNSRNCNNAIFKFDLSTLKALLRTNNLKRTQPGLQAVCLPEKILFENKSIGGEIFEWNMGDGKTIIKTDTIAFSYQYTAPRTTPYTVTLTVRDQGTCQVTDQVSTQVLVSGRQVQVQDDAKLCEEDTCTIQVNGNASFNWTSDPPGFTSTIRSPQVKPRVNTSYFVSFTEPSGCSYKDTVKVEVIQKLIPEFSISLLSQCEGNAFFEGTIQNLESADYTIEIFSGDGRTFAPGTFSFSYPEDGTYTFVVKSQKDFCVFQESKVLESFQLLLPNVITPGSKDGKNDTFIVASAKTKRPITEQGKKVSVSIVNRWGKTVYQSKDYQNDWSGEGLAAGVYYYEVQISGLTVCKDWLHIVK
ncbi:MAG: gliding motility-associated C-terminal domain-containing protein [Chryseotalea sp.]